MSRPQLELGMLGLMHEPHAAAVAGFTPWSMSDSILKFGLLHRIEFLHEGEPELIGCGVWVVAVEGGAVKRFDRRKSSGGKDSSMMNDHQR